MLMLALLLVPALLQMLVMFFDEFVFHRKRGLPRWERIGHPLDTATAALCYGWLLMASPASPGALPVYVALCAFSCLFITKDEFVHARLCEPLETWLHALLFVLHPIVFFAFGVIWRLGTAAWVLEAELFATLGLLAYQLLYWSPLWPRIQHKSRP
jgi:uncharacterized membrane protein